MNMEGRISGRETTQLLLEVILIRVIVPQEISDNGVRC